RLAHARPLIVRRPVGDPVENGQDLRRREAPAHGARRADARTRAVRAAERHPSEGGGLREETLAEYLAGEEAALDAAGFHADELRHLLRADVHGLCIRDRGLEHLAARAAVE